MYRSLCQASRYDCKDMDGFLTLLLVWAWIWMPSIGPLPVDTSFPLAHSSNWITPHVIPLEINDVVNLWSAIVPLICFEAVELHPTNRVRRQFGFYQDLPGEATQLKASHNIVLMVRKTRIGDQNMENGSRNGIIVLRVS
ncbi:hypothetical protein AHAS_Ahas13G0269100 [Arachis hypogaea]